MADFVETDCVIEHEGRKFESGGAYVCNGRIVAYCAAGGVLTDWHGNRLGSYRITSEWKTPRSYVSSTMWQVYAWVDGVEYTGRCAGIGMAFSGRAVKRQPSTPQEKLIHRG